MAWYGNKHRRLLAPEWENYEDMYKVVGDPPEPNMQIVRLRKGEVLGPNNWQWKLHERIKRGQFRNTILEIVKEFGQPLVIADIRHILITKYGEPQRLLHNVVWVSCSALVEQGALSKTTEKIAPVFSTGSKHSWGYGIPIVPVNYNKKVLWVIRKPNFTSSKIKPDKIVYDGRFPIIGHQLVGKYIGVDRLPAKLQNKEHYEAKGWRVIEL